MPVPPRIPDEPMAQWIVWCVPYGPRAWCVLRRLLLGTDVALICRGRDEPDRHRGADGFCRIRKVGAAWSARRASQRRSVGGGWIVDSRAAERHRAGFFGSARWRRVPSFTTWLGSFAGSLIRQTIPQAPTTGRNLAALTPCFRRFVPANSSLLPHGPLGLPRTAPCTRTRCRCVAQERCSSKTRPRTCSWGPVRRCLEVRRERRSIGTLGTSRISCHPPWVCDSDPPAQQLRFSRGAHDRTSLRRLQTLAGFF